MNETKLNQHLSDIFNSQDDVDSKVEIYEDYKKFVTYYISHILNEEKNINKYINSVFDSVFNQCKESELTGTDFLMLLSKTMILKCHEYLKNSTEEYNDWEANKFDFIPEIKESTIDMGIGNLELVSDKFRKFILNMLKDLPSQERIVAYSYYFLDLNVETIADVLELDVSIISATLNSVKYNIETNLKYLSQTTDDIQFSKLLIRNYLYTDLSTFTYVQNANDGFDMNISKKDLYDYQAKLYTDFSAPVEKPKVEEKPVKIKKQNKENNNEFDNKTNDKKTSKNKNNSKTLIILLIILAVVVIFASVFLFFYGSEIFGTNNTSTIDEKLINAVTKVSFDKEELYMYVGDEVKLNINVQTTSTEIPDLTKTSEISSGDSDVYWFYKLLDSDVISYNPSNQTIKANKSGKSVLQFVLNKYVEDEDLTQAVLVVYVFDKIEKFEISNNEEIIELDVDKTYNINYVISPSTSKDSIIWKSSDESIATIDDGVITGVSVGECSIVGSIPVLEFDGDTPTIKAKSISVYVKVNKALDKDAVVSASFKTKYETMKLFDQFTLDYVAMPSNDYVTLKIISSSKEQTFIYDENSNTITPLMEDTVYIVLLNKLTNKELDYMLVKFEMIME